MVQTRSISLQLVDGQPEFWRFNGGNGVKIPLTEAQKLVKSGGYHIKTSQKWYNKYFSDPVSISNIENEQGDNALGVVSDVIRNTGDVVGSFLGVGDKVGISDIPNTLLGGVKNVFTSFSGTVEDVTEDLGESAENIGEGIGSFITGITGGAGEGIEDIGGGIGSGLSNIGGGIGSGLSNIGGGVGTGLNQMILPIALLLGGYLIIKEL